MDVAEIIQRAGGATKLAKALHITHASICGWKRIPAGRLAEVSRIVGISPRELRPDLAALFASPPGTLAASSDTPTPDQPSRARTREGVV